MSKAPKSIDAVIAVAKKDLGVKESPIGSNSGPRVNQMLRTTGLGPGYYWCAAAVATWGRDALGATWPLPASADCDVLLAFARKRKILYTSPQSGDVFLLIRSGDPDDAYHTGIVVSVSSNAVVTVEGNTNGAGSSNGDGVYLKTRPINSLIRFIRWEELLTADEDEEWTANVAGVKQVMRVDAGVGYVALRTFLSALFGTAANARLGWDAETGQPTWGGDVLPFPCRMINGAAWCPLRAASLAFELSLGVDGANKTATVGFPAGAGK